MLPRFAVVVILSSLALVATAPPSAAVTLGQIDTFSGGTVEGWTSGGAPNPVAPVVVTSGGPGGAGDAYLRVSAIGGNGPGSRLTAINAAQWTGDYLAAGVAALRMHVANLGATDLSLRVLVSHVPPFAAATDRAISGAVVVPSGSGWIEVVIPVGPDDMTALIGDASVALATATEVRILHGVDAVFPPPAITGSLGVDDIEAADASVPTTETSWGRIKRLYR